MNRMTEPLVTIVVPVYKVEKYLNECVDSILRQSYKNFELILVNDGSPDRCGGICEDYKKKHSNIQVIHKANGGLSDARNAGIRVAKGEYITFVDSDDYISDDYLEKLVSAAVANDADFVQGQYTRSEFTADAAKEVKVFKPEEAFRKLLTWDTVTVYAWAKLYRLNLFKNIEYPVGRLNEDCCTTYKLILRSNKVVCIENEIYYYRVTPNSILTSKFNVKRFELWKVPEEISAYIGSLVDKYQDELDYYKMRIGINLINDSAESRSDPQIAIHQNEIISWLKRYGTYNPYTGRKYRTLVLLLTRFPKLYYMLIDKTRNKGNAQ